MVALCRTTCIYRPWPISHRPIKNKGYILILWVVFLQLSAGLIYLMYSASMSIVLNCLLLDLTNPHCTLLRPRLGSARYRVAPAGLGGCPIQGYIDLLEAKLQRAALSWAPAAKTRLDLLAGAHVQWAWCVSPFGGTPFSVNNWPAFHFAQYPSQLIDQLRCGLVVVNGIMSELTTNRRWSCEVISRWRSRGEIRRMSGK